MDDDIAGVELDSRSADDTTSSHTPDEPDSLESRFRELAGSNLPVVSSGAPFDFPRSSMTDEARAKLLESLRPALLSVLAERK